MRKAFLKSQRERLLEQREQTLKGIESEAAMTRDAQKDEGMDAYDLASEERDEAAAAGLRKRREIGEREQRRRDVGQGHHPR